MDMVVRFKAARRLSKAMAISFKEANKVLDKTFRQSKKQQGNV